MKYNDAVNDRTSERASEGERESYRPKNFENFASNIWNSKVISLHHLVVHQEREKSICSKGEIDIIFSPGIARITTISCSGMPIAMQTISIFCNGFLLYEVGIFSREKQKRGENGINEA